MLKKFKKILYFRLAAYFRFFARIYLRRWNPKVIVVTGSQGKTTLLHLLESQIGDRAIYSHNANSAYGIPFHILGLKRVTFSIFEWPILFLCAPFKIFRRSNVEKIYVVEADCDCHYNGVFLADLLIPNITLWISSSRTHSMNFRVNPGETIEQVIAEEFGNFAQATRDLVIANGDIHEIASIVGRLSVPHRLLQQSEFLADFAVKKCGTEFTINDRKYIFPYLLPKDVAYSIAMVEIVCRELGVIIDPSFSKLTLPPGRSSVFNGTRGRTLIDSSYNASLESMRGMIGLFAAYPQQPKWLVLGDMLELGKFEREEHEKLARYIIELKPARVVLVGPRLRTSTYPILQESGIVTITVDGPREALMYIEKESVGGEAILFKGARFLEGVVEALLYDINDVAKLARREQVWQKRRKKWNI
jgi:UDP-N-acetylmuramoyl-tripeptide--D-alanyl-D-alanine ligase